MLINTFRFHTPHYFSKHPSRGLQGLYWSVGMMDFGMAAVSLFEPIFLFTIGYALYEVMFFYVLLYGAYVLLLPIIGRWVGKFGYEHSIFYSQFFLIAGYLLLYGVSQLPWLFFVTPFIFAIQKSLYWPAYHADFTVFSQQGQRGREVSYLETISMIVFIVGPLIGGAILSWTNYSVLFIMVSVIFLFSAMPLLRIKEIHSKVHIPYREIYGQLFDRQHRRSFFTFLGFGEELIVLTAWPIFIYVVVGNFFEIGGIASIATLVTAVLVLWFGTISDKYKRINVLRTGTLMYAATWLLRGFARTAGGVLVMDTGSRLSKELLFIPMEAIRYGKARFVGPLRYSIFYELSLGIGKLLAGLIAFFITLYISDPWVPLFMVAGGFTLFYFSKKEHRPAAKLTNV